MCETLLPAFQAFTAKTPNVNDSSDSYGARKRQIHFCYLPVVMELETGTCAVEIRKANHKSKVSSSERILLNDVRDSHDYRRKSLDSLAILEKEKNSIGNEDTIPLTTNDMKYEVAFDTVTVREYGMILGDNPSCSYGPPVQLDWEYFERPVEDLDIYEEARGERRKLQQLGISYYRRKYLLSKAGHSRRELKDCTRQINITKRQRSTTNFFLITSKVEEAFESMNRCVKRTGSK